MILTLLIHLVSAFFATIFFSIIFNVQKKHLIACGAIGALGWGVYIWGVLLGYSGVLFTFLGAYLVAQSSYFLAKHKRAPVTIYLIPGIIPLVPGIGLYRTMYALLFSDHSTALEYALTTFQLSGVIAWAIILAALLPLLFHPGKSKL